MINKIVGKDGKELKENNHHLFSYPEITERLKEIYGEPTNDFEHKRISDEAFSIWKKLPQFKLDVKRHKNLHKVDNMTSNELKVEYKRIKIYTKFLEEKLNKLKKELLSKIGDNSDNSQENLSKDNPAPLDTLRGSKIGDVQQSKEKREGLYLSDEQ
jgi:hypothetical protein